MGLLVEYSIADGKADEQAVAMERFVAGLSSETTEGFSYTAFSTDDPRRFIGVFEFDDDAAKQRFLGSAAFAAYRDGAAGRFTAPPQTTPIRRIASTM